MTEALFTSACRERLNHAIKLVEERGSQYGDTLKDCQWLVMRSVFDLIAEEEGLLDKELARALAIAALVDIKYQRFQGGYKEDNVDDGINYLSILPEMIRLAKYGPSQISSGETEQS